jgi:hypothetical protein
MYASDIRHVFEEISLISQKETLKNRVSLINIGLNYTVSF